jgi:hypothetical protein
VSAQGRRVYKASDKVKTLIRSSMAKKEGVAAAADQLKLLATVASGVLAFSAGAMLSSSAATFPGPVKWLLMAAIACMLLSLGCGIFSIGFVTSQMASGKYDINEFSFRGFAAAAILTFGGGMLLLTLSFLFAVPLASGPKVVSPSDAVMAAKQALSKTAKTSAARITAIRDIRLLHGNGTDDAWDVTFALRNKKTDEVIIDSVTGSALVMDRQ